MVKIKSWCCGEVICSGATIAFALQRAVRDGIPLRYADLSYRFLPNLCLVGVDLRNADLTGSTFYNTDLSESSLAGAKVVQTIFTNANLSGVDVTGVDMSQAVTTGAKMAGMYQSHQPRCTDEAFEWLWQTYMDRCVSVRGRND